MKKIEINHEAEIVLMLSVDDQGRANVHAHRSVALSDGTVKGASGFAEIFVPKTKAR